MLGEHQRGTQACPRILHWDVRYRVSNSIRREMLRFIIPRSILSLLLCSSPYMEDSSRIYLFWRLDPFNPSESSMLFFKTITSLSCARSSRMFVDIAPSSVTGNCIEPSSPCATSCQTCATELILCYTPTLIYTAPTLMTHLSLSPSPCFSWNLSSRPFPCLYKISPQNW